MPVGEQGDRQPPQGLLSPDHGLGRRLAQPSPDQRAAALPGQDHASAAQFDRLACGFDRMHAGLGAGVGRGVQAPFREPGFEVDLAREAEPQEPVDDLVVRPALAPERVLGPAKVSQQGDLEPRLLPHFADGRVLGTLPALQVSLGEDPLVAVDPPQQQDVAIDDHHGAGGMVLNHIPPRQPAPLP